jgi:hypothetical protein
LSTKRAAADTRADGRRSGCAPASGSRRPKGSRGKSKLERFVVTTERAHLGDARGIDDRECVRAGAFQHADRVPELLAQPRVDRRGVERHQARTPTGSVFRTIQRSCWIFC